MQISCDAHVMLNAVATVVIAFTLSIISVPFKFFFFISSSYHLDAVLFYYYLINLFRFHKRQYFLCGRVNELFHLLSYPSDSFSSSMFLSPGECISAITYLVSKKKKTKGVIAEDDNNRSIF